MATINILQIDDLPNPSPILEPKTSPKPNSQILALQKARGKTSFNIFDLSCVIHGSASVVKARRAAFSRVETLLGTNDTTKLPRSYANQNRSETYLEGLEWGKACYEDGLKYKHSFFDNVTHRYMLANSNPFGMTTVMFLPALKLLATAEQKKKWIPLAEKGMIIGAYCQTELGHGTFVRGIETTATLDMDTDEFVIHSPSLSSTKFWPGAIGFSCTHAIVVARLMVRDKDYGPHLFMMQFRSLKDGTPLPGIELGDLGLKMSYNGTDNGFATFNHCRIPRTNMLMAHTSVYKKGIVKQSPQAKLSYGTLILVRNIIVNNVAFQLAQAVTIATRYSTVREQGLGPNGLAHSETPLIAYKSQHFRLLTIIANAYAILFASRTSDAVHATLRQQQENGNHSLLPYTHTFLAGLKAWSTQIAADGAEDSRKCCGGQGYLNISGLPEIVAAVTATATFEGENYVLWQQVARYLFKCVDRLKEGHAIDQNMEYLANGYECFADHAGSDFEFADIPGRQCAAHGKDFLDPVVQSGIYRHRALRMIFATYTAVRSSTKKPMDAWNEHMMIIIGAARAHIEYFVLQSFITQVSTLPTGTPQPVITVLSRLTSLFALSTITNPQSTNALTFIEDNHLSLSQLNTIRSLVNELLDQLLPDAVGLTDAWDFTDASLCSAIGMRDGNVYETVMSWVRQLPINVDSWERNRGVFQPGWRRWVDPVLRAKL